VPLYVAPLSVMLDISIGEASDMEKQAKRHIKKRAMRGMVHERRGDGRVVRAFVKRREGLGIIGN
jgi:hypothetical protein